MLEDEQDCADLDEVHDAVTNACRIINKRDDDKEKFIRAIEDVVVGRLNIRV